MSKRDLRLFLEDILEAIAKIERYVGNQTLDEFLDDDMAIDAVVRNLEIIGEADRQIPKPVRARYSHIDWRRVVGFRNVAIHAYFDVDPEIVWVIATQRLGELKRTVERMLVDLSP